MPLHLWRNEVCAPVSLVLTAHLVYPWMDAGNETTSSLTLQVRDIFKRVRDSFPGAEVKASTFDAYSEKLLAAAPSLDLPVITGEVGDTWINGIASDPLKVSRYRDLLRLRRGLIDSSFPDSYALQNFSRFLLKVKELNCRSTHLSQSVQCCPDLSLAIRAVTVDIAMQQLPSLTPMWQL